MVVSLWGLLWNSRIFVKVIRAAAILAGAVLFTQTDAFKDNSKNTSIAELFDGSVSGVSGFSSLTNCMEVLSSFANQFAVAPVTCIFRAEIISGADTRNPFHSLSFTFLTHAGIIGTFIFFAILIIVFRKRFLHVRAIDHVKWLFGYLVFIMFAIGTSSAFKSLSMFRFRKVALSDRPSKLLERI